MAFDYAQVLALLREAAHGLGDGADLADDSVPAAFDLLNNPSRSVDAIPSLHQPILFVFFAFAVDVQVVLCTTACGLPATCAPEQVTLLRQRRVFVTRFEQMPRKRLYWEVA